METSDKFVEEVKLELKRLDALRKPLLEYLAASNAQPKIIKPSFLDGVEYGSKPTTIRERIFATIDIIIKNKNGTSVRVPEIHEYVLKNDIDIGNTKHPRSLIFSIIRQELKKGEQSKIAKVRKGFYKLK